MTVDARALDRAGEGLERLLGILLVDADAALDRHRHLTGAFMAATQSPTCSGSAIRQAPKRPSCTDPTGSRH